MTRSKAEENFKDLGHSFFFSIHGKIIFWALLPSLAVIGGLTLLSSITLRSTALEVSIKRDVELAEISADRLAESIHKYPLYLRSIVDGVNISELRNQKLDWAPYASSNLLHIFDGGLHFFDYDGKLLWSYSGGEWSENLFFPDKRKFEKLRESFRPIYTNIMRFERDGQGYINISVPVLDDDNTFSGVLAGLCSIDESTLGTAFSKVLEYKSGESSYAYLVDGNGSVLYHRHSSLIGIKTDDQEVVKHVADGLAGARAMKDSTGETVISGYAPVKGTDWEVITQSDWSHIQNLLQLNTNILLGVLALGGLVSAIVVFHIIQKLLDPVRALTSGAEKVAEGKFVEIPVTKSGDEIEVLTKQFNFMTRTIQASFIATEKRMKELEWAHKKLSLSEERINSIINAVRDMMMMVDRNGRILWINKAGKRVFGEDAEAYKYQELLYRQKDFPDDCFIQKFFVHNRVSDVELSILVDDKFQHYWCSAGAVEWYDDSSVGRAVVVFRNLTEKKQLREEVLRNAQLAALGQLAAGVAHEINNPVNGILNYAQIVDDKWDRDLNSRHAQLPSKIIKEAERVALIVSKLLSFARADTERKVAVDIREVIDDSLDLLGASLEKEGIDVHIDVAENLPRCKAVIHQLRQIYLNVIGNARYALNLKYPGFHPGKRLSISCRLVMVNDVQMVRSRFKDTGTGIAKNILEKVCNPFFSTKPPGEGTGLGLSISYGIIEEHGGELSLISSPGNWTEVIIDLPVWKQRTLSDSENDQ